MNAHNTTYVFLIGISPGVSYLSVVSFYITSNVTTTKKKCKSYNMIINGYRNLHENT